MSRKGGQKDNIPVVRAIYPEPQLKIRIEIHRADIVYGALLLLEASISVVPWKGYLNTLTRALSTTDLKADAENITLIFISNYFDITFADTQNTLTGSKNYLKN